MRACQAEGGSRTRLEVEEGEVEEWSEVEETHLRWRCEVGQWVKGGGRSGGGGEWRGE